MDAEVDAREGHEDGQCEQERDRAPNQDGEDDRARKRRRGVAGRKGAAQCPAEERIRLGNGRGGPWSIDRGLDDDRDQVGRPDTASGERGRGNDPALRPEGETRREGDPDEAGVPDDAERNEDRVEPPDTVLDDPDEGAAVYARKSCFVEASSCSGSNGFPMNAWAPASSAAAASSSAIFPLNMTTGMASTP